MLKGLRGAGCFDIGGTRLAFVVATHGSTVDAVVQRGGLGYGTLEKQLFYWLQQEQDEGRVSIAMEFPDRWPILLPQARVV